MKKKTGKNKESMRKKFLRPSVWRRTGPPDRTILFCVIALILFGVIMVYSASAPYATKKYGDPQFYFKRDLVYAALAIVMMFIVSRIDYRIYERFAFPIYAFSFLLCLAVFIPGIGASINNSRRWIQIANQTFMPSDILKIGSICFLSYRLTRKPPEQNGTLRMLCWVLGFVLITILPVYFQPNFSAVMVIALSLMFVYFVGGMNLWHLLPMMGFGILGLLYAFWPRPGNYRLERLLIVFNPLKDPQNSGWQLLQSLYAVSSGGLWGVGFGQSRQKFDYLADEPHNDFIFSVISEELGFIGAMCLILAFVYLIWRCLRAANRANSAFGRLFGFGLSFIIAFQAMVNIGVSIGLVPPTGITLPFVSYGGSSLIVMGIIAGILLNISKDSR